MALIIKRQGKFVLIEGSINTSTAMQFKNHIEFLQLHTETLIINIDHVDEIDASGIQVLKDLYNNSLIINKKLEIIGYDVKTNIIS